MFLRHSFLYQENVGKVMVRFQCLIHNLSPKWIESNKVVSGLNDPAEVYDQKEYHIFNKSENILKVAVIDKCARD